MSNRPSSAPATTTANMGADAQVAATQSGVDNASGRVDKAMEDIQNAKTEAEKKEKIEIFNREFDAYQAAKRALADAQARAAKIDGGCGGSCGGGGGGSGGGGGGMPPMLPQMPQQGKKEEGGKSESGGGGGSGGGSNSSQSSNSAPATNESASANKITPIEDAEILPGLTLKPSNTAVASTDETDTSTNGVDTASANASLTESANRAAALNNQFANLADAAVPKSTPASIKTNQTAATQSNGTTGNASQPTSPLGFAMSASPSRATVGNNQVASSATSRTGDLSNPSRQTGRAMAGESSTASSSASGEEPAASGGFSFPGFGGGAAAEESGGNAGNLVHNTTSSGPSPAGRGVASTRQVGKVMDPDAPVRPGPLSAVMQGQYLVIGSPRPKS